jgi:hypothetical protein
LLPALEEVPPAPLPALPPLSKAVPPQAVSCEMPSAENKAAENTSSRARSFMVTH